MQHENRRKRPLRNSTKSEPEKLLGLQNTVALVFYRIRLLGRSQSTTFLKISFLFLIKTLTA